MYLEERLDEIKTLLTGAISPYLTLYEASHYLKLSPSTIKKQMGNTLFLGRHYFKPTGDKILFAKIELDIWVKEDAHKQGDTHHGINTKEGQYALDKIISQWRSHTQIDGTK